MDQNIEQKSIEIKQRCKIATPDTIIGATALLYNLTVVSRNNKDFKKINGLKLYNPFE
ncbi:MAG: PIN domain-containing protein [Bacteroidales bacterium]|nr:PIN domain-containing protein [Bacteroidales bacterium]